MAQGSQSGRTVVAQARKALDELKYEVAREIGVTPPSTGYWGDMPARQCGAVGGHMVRSMIELAEQHLAGR
jgi:hypothetical protein